jgi:hypothetical protein
MADGEGEADAANGLRRITRQAIIRMRFRGEIAPG